MTDYCSHYFSDDDFLCRYPSGTSNYCYFGHFSNNTPLLIYGTRERTFCQEF